MESQLCPGEESPVYEVALRRSDTSLPAEEMLAEGTSSGHLETTSPRENIRSDTPAVVATVLREVGTSRYLAIEGSAVDPAAEKRAASGRA